jgi:putative endonuclease
LSLPDLIGQSRKVAGIEGENYKLIHVIMEKYYYVYILANNRNGTLYIGITSEIVKRIWQHREKVFQGFTEKYNINKLVYYEIFKDPQNAIKREKRLKKYKREWKINIIEKDNPEWKDLYDQLISGLPEQVGQ